MELKTLKALALTSAVALGFAYASPAQAQTETVTASLTTSSAITTVFTSNIAFGEFLIQFATGDTPTLRKTNDGTNTVTQTGSVANGSQVVEITPGASEGVVTVDIPAPATLQMVASNLTPFVDAGLTLDVVTYRTASENGSIVTGGAATAAVPVTVVTGAGTAETVTFGGEIDVSATPGDGAHTASFDVTFSY